MNCKLVSNNSNSWIAEKGEAGWLLLVCGGVVSDIGGTGAEKR
jgi:hypothetical protein